MIRVECCKFLNLYGHYVLREWVVFNNFLLIDATDRSKISSDQKRLFFAVSIYPLLFFANTSLKTFVCSSSTEIGVWNPSKSAWITVKPGCTLHTVWTRHSWSDTCVPGNHWIFYAKHGFQNSKRKYLFSAPPRK